MKTSMQELLVLVEQMFANANNPEVESAMNDVINIITQEGIPKEKDQMVNAFEVGYKSCDIDEAFEINRKLASGENHYNKTYNQTL